MNATDIYVEQLIIGGMVILIAVVLWTGGVPNVEANAVNYVIIAGAAYLVGILYDRIGDSLLERIEQRLRLSFAIKEATANRPKYLEGTFRIAVLREGGDLAKQLGYLRTRVRLARGVVTLLPAATIALLAHHAKVHGARVVFPVIAIYTAVAVLNTRVTKKRAVPRTEDATPSTVAGWPVLAEPVVICFLLLGGMMVWLASVSNERRYAIAVGGFFGTLVATWVWMRITGTFNTFLRDANRVDD